MRLADLCGCATITADEAVDLTIYNAMMQIVHAGRINGRAQIDLAGWSAGSYYIRHGNIVQKLMIVR